MLAYTDYPITVLGDEPYEEAPIREVEVLYRDTPKYVTIRVEGVTMTLKRWYLYTEPGRVFEVPEIDITKVPYADGTYEE